MVAQESLVPNHLTEGNESANIARRHEVLVSSRIMDGSDSRENEPASYPKILVLLAAYNGERWIGEQLRSILDQKMINVRLVVRDDGSSDGTAADVGRFADQDARIELVKADVPSGSAAQNFFSLIRANDAIGFDYVSLSDQDDIWNHDKLLRSVEALKQSGGAAVSSSVIAFWPQGNAKLLMQNPAMTDSDFLFEGAGQGCTFLLTMQFYARLRTFLIDYEMLTRKVHYHDWSIYALARTWRLNWTFISAPTLKYRQHADNDTGARNSVSGIALRLGRIRSGWYLDQLRAIAQLCHAAASADPLICDWHRTLGKSPSWRRRISIAATCIRGGRRRVSDNIALIASALLGAI